MIDRLIERITEMDAPVVAGLDPTMAHIPGFIKENAFKEYGETLEGAALAVKRFNFALIDALADIVPAVKPQAAMYEQFGIPGMMVYRDTIAYAHEKGLIVIGDVKRGDIGSTSAAYANAHIGQIAVGEAQYAPFDEDFCTVNPYLGSDGIRPFLEACEEYDRGIFVLAKTSNPSSGEFQDRLIDGRPLYEHVAEKIAAWGEDLIGTCGWSEVGAVAGATYPEVIKTLREIMPHTFLLVPGYGAQGAGAAELAPCFDADGLGAIVNSSRGIIAAYKKDEYARFGEEGFADAARQAALDMIEDLKTCRAHA